MNFGYSWIFKLRPFRGSKISLEELKFKNPKFDMLKIRQIFLGPHNICALRSAGSHRPNYPRETPLPSYLNNKSSTPTTPPPPLINAHRRCRPHTPTATAAPSNCTASSSSQPYPSAQRWFRRPSPTCCPWTAAPTPPSPRFRRWSLVPD
jgi:hypothetical protein